MFRVEDRETRLHRGAPSHVTPLTLDATIGFSLPFWAPGVKWAKYSTSKMNTVFMALQL